MTRATTLGSAIVLVVLATLVGPLRGDPPIRIGPDAIANLGSSQSAVPPSDPLPVPHLESYSHSDCKEDSGGGRDWPCGDDEFELTVEGDSLHVLHRDAWYNCCLDDIVISLSIEESLLRFTEEEILTEPCWCECCFDVEATVVDLAPGTYTVEFYWFDYETGQVQCWVGEVEIPRAGGGPLRGDPPVQIGPGSIVELDNSEASEPGFDPLPVPHVESYSDSGCTEGPDGDPEWPCGEDEIELTVKGDSLHVAHRNATYNCCRDEIAISLSVHGSLLRLTEEEILTVPCDCWCCYDVEATVVDLAPGTYTVEFYWFDYETVDIVCWVGEIVIPGSGGGPLRGDPPACIGPDGVTNRTTSQTSPLNPDPPPAPHVQDYSNSGCLDNPDDPNIPWFGPCGDDEFEFTVAVGTLHVLHRNALYNCCPDDIVIALSVEGHVLTLTEEEVLTNPCYCVCCYNVEATIADLAPGEYVVEFHWYDYDTHQVQLYVETVVIP